MASGHFSLSLIWIAKSFTYQDKIPEFLGYIAVIILSAYLAIYPAIATGMAHRLSKKYRRSDADILHKDQGQRAYTPGESILWRVFGGKDYRHHHGHINISMDSRYIASFALLFAAFWGVSEWLRANILTGFAWNPLGVAFLNITETTNFALMGAIIGSYGLSMLLILLSALFLIALSIYSKPYKAIILIAYTALLIFGIQASGHNLLNHEEAPEIIIIQPNIKQEDKWEGEKLNENFEKLISLTSQALAASPGPSLPKNAFSTPSIKAGDSVKNRLIFWTEVAIPFYLEEGYPPQYYGGIDPKTLRQYLAGLLRDGDYLILGASALEFDTSTIKSGQSTLSSARNAVFILNARGEILGRYDKAHLLPFGEYLPLRSILEPLGLSRFAPGSTDFAPGDGPANLDIPGVIKMGIQICYEIIFPGEITPREDRPHFIFNPSNDAWFGDAGPKQHLKQARLRAIEEGLPIIRSTPTGVSAIIDAKGKIMAKIAQNKAGYLVSKLPKAAPPTLFAHYGNIIPFILALVFGIAGLAIGRRYS